MHSYTTLDLSISLGPSQCILSFLRQCGGWLVAPWGGGGGEKGVQLGCSVWLFFTIWPDFGTFLFDEIKLNFSINPGESQLVYRSLNIESLNFKGGLHFPIFKVFRVFSFSVLYICRIFIFSVFVFSRDVLDYPEKHYGQPVQLGGAAIVCTVYFKLRWDILSNFSNMILIALM